MRLITLIHYGEGWKQTTEGFLVDRYTIVQFFMPEESLEIYRFPQSLETKDTAHYFADDQSIKRMTIRFEGFRNLKPFDITKPMVEIIKQLSEEGCNA